eukprot:gene9890-12689_t
MEAASAQASRYDADLRQEEEAKRRLAKRKNTRSSLTRDITSARSSSLHIDSSSVGDESSTGSVSIHRKKSSELNLSAQSPTMRGTSPTAREAILRSPPLTPSARNRTLTPGNTSRQAKKNMYGSTMVQEEIGGSTVRNGSSSSRQRPGDNADSASKDNLLFPRIDGRVDLNHFTDRFYPPGFFEEHALLSGMHKSTSDTGSSRRESFLDPTSRSDVRTAQKRLDSKSNSVPVEVMDSRPGGGGGERSRNTPSILT